MCARMHACMQAEARRLEETMASVSRASVALAEASGTLAAAEAAVQQQRASCAVVVPEVDAELARVQADVQVRGQTEASLC